MQGNPSSNFKMVLRLFFYLLIFLFLTVVTQIGGLIFLLSLGMTKWLWKKYNYQRLLCMSIFLVLYLFATFLIIPLLAPISGRKALPVSGDMHLQPANFTSYVLNRHYVKDELLEAIIDISNKMHLKHPGIKTLYLDANFPFFEGFPLLPHLSHDDGEKIDLAFIYQSTDGTPLLNQTPTITGYGYFIPPIKGESNYTKICKEKGNWQYDFTGKLTFVNKERYALDKKLMQDLLSIIAINNKIKKVFIEPHLIKRLGFEHNQKFRFQGCHSVRHDDHIHLQL